MQKDFPAKYVGKQSGMVVMDRRNEEPVDERMALITMGVTMG